MKTIVDSKSDEGCRLDELAVGQQAVVVSLAGEGPIERRLMDLGLLPDTAVQLLRRAPLGDPSVYSLRGYQLCLRRADAGRIRVRVVTEAGQPVRPPA